MRSYKEPYKQEMLNSSPGRPCPQGLAMVSPGSPSRAFGGVVQGFLDTSPALLTPTELMAPELLLWGRFCYLCLGIRACHRHKPAALQIVAPKVFSCAWQCGSCLQFSGCVKRLFVSLQEPLLPRQQSWATSEEHEADWN